MQLNCGTCGGSLNLTDQWRKRGSIKCPYCDAENKFPQEVLSAHDERPEKPKDSNIRHKRTTNSIEVHIGPRGFTEVSNLYRIGFVLCSAFTAGALLGGFYVNRLLWIIAGTFVYLSYNLLKAVVHPYLNHRLICINTDTFIYEEYDRLPGIGLRLWHIKREFAVSQLRSIQLRTMPIKAGDEPNIVLVMDYGKRLEVLGCSPNINSKQELQWLDYEIHDFLTELDRKRNLSGQSSIPAARRDTVSVSHGIDLRCFSCGSPVELTVEAIMKRAAPCNYCGSEVILHHRVWPDLLAINEKFEHAGKKVGSPIRVYLAKNSMRIEVPPRGFTEGSITNLGIDLMLSISMVVLGYVLVEQSFVSKYGAWFQVGAVLCLLPFLLSFKDFLHVFRAVFGSVTITIDGEKCTISRRLFMGIRQVSYRTGSILRARFDTGSARDPGNQGNSGIFRDLSIEIRGRGGEKIETLVYADFGDEWQWIADEINAFKASLEIKAKI